MLKFHCIYDHKFPIYWDEVTQGWRKRVIASLKKSFSVSTIWEIVTTLKDEVNMEIVNELFDTLKTSIIRRLLFHATLDPIDHWSNNELYLLQANCLIRLLDLSSYHNDIIPSGNLFVSCLGVVELLLESIHVKELMSSAFELEDHQTSEYQTSLVLAANWIYTSRHVDIKVDPLSGFISKQLENIATKTLNKIYKDQIKNVIPSQTISLRSHVQVQLKNSIFLTGVPSLDFSTSSFMEEFSEKMLPRCPASFHTCTERLQLVCACCGRSYRLSRQISLSWDMCAPSCIHCGLILSWGSAPSISRLTEPSIR